MRIKITFSKTFKSPNLLPLHHQMVLSRSLSPFTQGIMDDKTVLNFSSIKGSSNVKDGNISFLNNKLNLIVSSNNETFLKTFVDRIFEKYVIKVGKMLLMPKVQVVVPTPDFTNEMKYLCLSPFVIIDPTKEPDKTELIIDPTTQEFSDYLFVTTMQRMLEAGYSEDELKAFETFEAIADADYLKRINDNNKRYARFYRNLAGQTLVGYLLPFILHAHPKVQEFLFNSGLGLFTAEGYGMIDIVVDKPEPEVVVPGKKEDESNFSGPSAEEFFS